MRLAFMGSPDFSVPVLNALVEAGHEVATVYCQPPRRAGRGGRLTPCPVHRAAEALGLPVRTPAGLRRNEAEHAGFAALDLEAAVVVAYGLLLPRAMLDAPRRGCLNVHASLLPRWRGAAPIQAAILAGDRRTGVTIMRMEEGLDTGPMLLTEDTPIGPRDTSADLHDRLSAIGARLILRALAENPAGVPQPDEGVTHVGKISKADGRLDWGRDAASLERQIRAYHPWPGTFFEHGGEAIRVLEAEPADGAAAPGIVLDEAGLIACGDNTALRLRRLQRPGRGALETTDFLRGFPLEPGQVLD